MSLWNDVDAVARLAWSRESLESPAGGPPAGDAVRRPVPPEVRGLPQISVVACGSPSKMVGGDLHEAFMISDRTLALAIGDVSGKGVPAALLMEITRSLVRNLSASEPSPGAVLTRLNRVLHEADLGSMYVTIFLAWYDLETGTLRYANAGHPIPLRVVPGGRVSSFGRVTGPILGILDVERYEEETARLAPGERLILFTDGVTEAPDHRDRPFGERRLRAFLRRRADEPLEQICRSLHDEIAAFQNGRRHDDASLLAFQRNS